MTQKTKKGFIFSIDSMLGIALVILIASIFIVQPLAKNPIIQLNVLNKSLTHDYGLIAFYTNSETTDIIIKDERSVDVEGIPVTVKDAEKLNIQPNYELAEFNKKFVYCTFYYQYDINTGNYYETGTKGNTERKEICIGVS
jgi:hypothetical protein